MKKKYTQNLFLAIFTSACILFNGNAIFAQNPIPNPGFETWSGGEPEGWNTINQSILGTSFIAVTRDQTNPHSGTSSAKLETITENIFIVGPVTVPGIITLGEIEVDLVNQTGTVTGGIPVTTQPQQLRGWFRYEPQGGDSCIMGIGLSKWNGTSRDTLAYSYRTFGGSTPDWQEFSVPVDYLLWEMPDTMNVMFFSSNMLNGTIITGSTLWIDDLWIEYGPVSVKEHSLAREFRLSPDGSGNSFTAFIPDAEGGLVQIFSLSGSMVGGQIIAKGETQRAIAADHLTSGLYIARFTSNAGHQAAVKFVKK